MFKVTLGAVVMALSFNDIASAQTIQLPSTQAHVPEKVAIALYHSTLGQNAQLYSGSEYTDYSSSTKTGHQFYETERFEKASLLYGGLKYEDVPILFDIVSDEVIVGVVNKEGFIDQLKIDKYRLSSFRYLNKTFIHLTDPAKGVTSGFYELLYNGKSQVLAKRKKEYKKEVVEISFPEDDHYYVLQEGKYYPVKTKKSVLKLFSDQKKPLVQFLRENNITFSENRELAIARLAEQYDLLKD